MRVGGTSGGWSPIARTFGSSLSIGRIGSVPAASSSTSGTPTRDAMRAFAKDLDVLRDELQTLARLDDRIDSSKRGKVARARGSLTLSDSTTDATAATLRSTEQVNTQTTSYSTETPAWTGSSTAEVEVSGTYDGAQGDTTLRFEVTGQRLFGNNGAEIEVRDDDGTLIETLTYRPGVGNSTQELSNGLSLYLSTTILELGDMFSMAVSSSGGTNADPEAAFDEDAAFDEGQAVTSGSFTVNGEEIAVEASDSINAVLERINTSNAGVTASFDAETDSVVLTQETLGAAGQIELGPDSSGFLSAVKLVDAVIEAGEDGGGQLESTESRISELGALSAVSSGTFQIDDTEIAYDIANDSIEDIVDRISAVDGIRASVNNRGELSISGPRSGFTISGDDGGLLRTLGVEEREYRGRRAERGSRLTRREEVARSVVALTSSFNDLMRSDREGVSGSLLGETRSRLTTAAGGALARVLDRAGTGSLVSGLGIDLTAFDESNTRAMDLNITSLSKALRANDGALGDLLFGDGERDGLIQSLAAAVDAAANKVSAALSIDGSLGFRVDTYG